MKKKLLFVIPSLDAGGAEKSLINLLNTIDETRFSVDLYLFTHRGLFLSQVPQFVNILAKNDDIKVFQKSLLSSVIEFLKKGKVVSALHRIQFFLTNKTSNNSSTAEQYSWKYIKKSFDSIDEEYDAAIGFLEKSSIYFVVDKVKSKNKIGFIHNDYNKLSLDKMFDKHYFKYLKHIATVSEQCVEVLKKEFPESASKVKLVNNIVSSKLIKSLSEESIERLKTNSIVSVGRLHPQKGFDVGLEAVTILKDKNIDFHWYIIGEGNERSNLEASIAKNNLDDYVTLLGLKKNPYPYIKQTKVFVQPSRYEGKSIAIDEAKILCKPIILTNFTTAKDQINHNINGLICEMTPLAIAESILKYLEDEEFTNSIVSNLQADHFGTEAEIEKFYQIIE